MLNMTPICHQALCSVCALASVWLSVASVVADDLVIGARTELAMDPHVQWLDTNAAYYNHLYSALVRIDERSQLKPGLAESWTAVSETEWHFKLRKDATFHDGSRVTATDVVASVKRARTLPTATSPYTGAIGTVKEVTALDDGIVAVTTTRPDPVVANGLQYISVLPAKIAEAVTTEMFNTGKSIVGSGPYKFVSYKAGDSLVLERDPAYWGPKAKWNKVTFRFIPDDTARVAALLSGDVHVIDFVPPRLVERIRRAANTSLFVGPSDRPIFLMMDTEREGVPFIRDLDGKPLAKNPFKDRRIRQALTLAIDRDLLTTRVMDGAATPASQIFSPSFGGYSDTLKVPPFDVEAAKALLAEAGYANGFGLTLHCTNDRYVNDEKVCQAIGQMLARIGLKMDVQTMPRSVFFPVATNHKDNGRFVFLLLGYASGADAGIFSNLIHSYDPERKLGTWNLGHYSNSEVDKAIEASITTMDLKKRAEGLAAAMKLAMEDYGYIPLYVQSVIVATRKGLTYTTWANERTIADSVSIAK